MPLLQAKNLSVSYGYQQVVHDLNFHVNSGEIVILMGPNGAGKSTVLKALFGLIPHHSGDIEWQGKRINPKPYRMVEEGVSFVPQGNAVFSSMTVEENLLMGAFLEDDQNTIEDKLEEVYGIFSFLKNKRFQLAQAMSGGERQILALGRALMTSPKLLMLDEPSLGLAPKIVSEVFDKIREINVKFGASIVVVEHNLKSLLNIAHRGYILVGGKIMIEGPVENVSQSEVLEKAFFGELS